MENNIQGKLIIIHFTEMIGYCLKRIWIMLLLAVLFGGIAFGYSSYQAKNYANVTPMYKSASKLYMGNIHINNYKEIMVSRNVLEGVISDLGLNMTYEELKGCISTYVPTNTTILEITVVFPDAEWAKIVCDAVVQKSANSAMSILQSGSPVIYEAAVLPNAPYNTGRAKISKRLVLGGAMAGFILGAFLALCAYFGRKAYRNPDMVEDTIGLTTLGVIPTTEDEKNAAMIPSAYLHFMERILSSDIYKKTLFISGSVKDNQEAAMLGLADQLCAYKKKVVLIDTKANHPEWGVLADDVNKEGLSELLSGDKKVASVISLRESGLAVIGSGSNPNFNMPELLRSDRFARLIDELSASYDYVFVNSAPVGYSEDITNIRPLVTAGLWVISEKGSKVSEARETKKKLISKNIGVNGVVLTDVDVVKSGKYFIKHFGEYVGKYNM